MAPTSALSRAQLAWPHLQIEIVNERGH
jgi:hypothetical protein